MGTTKVRIKRKKSEIVAAKLRDYIIRHRLRPGDRLPTEEQLTELFGLSRVTVREATKALGFLGIIDAAPRRGLTVGRVSMRRVSRYLGFHFATANLPIEELVASRVVIETGGLARVSERMAEDPRIYSTLNDLNDRLRRATKTREWFETDLQFHRQLVASSGLRALAAFNDLLQVFFERLRKDFPRSEWKVGVKGHQAIIDALKAGEPDKAGRLLREHIETHKHRARNEATH